MDNIPQCRLPAYRCAAFAGNSMTSDDPVPGLAEADQASRRMVRNPRRAGSDPTAAPPMPEHRRPCRCFRERPYRIVVVAAIAVPRQMVAAVSAEKAVVVEALEDPAAAASCILVVVEPRTLAFADTQVEQVGSNSSSAAVDMDRSMEVDHKSEAGRTVH